MVLSPEIVFRALYVIEPSLFGNCDACVEAASFWSPIRGTNTKLLVIQDEPTSSSPYTSWVLT